MRFWLILNSFQFIFKYFLLKLQNKLELSSAKLRRLMRLSWKKFDEMIFDSLEAILKDA